MSSCKVCGFDPEEYGYRPEEAASFSRGGQTALVTCARCGCDVCTHHSETGPVSGYDDDWSGAVLCADCANALRDESAAQWEEEYGDSGFENPYVHEGRP